MYSALSGVFLLMQLGIHLLQLPNLTFTGRGIDFPETTQQQIEYYAYFSSNSRQCAQSERLIES